jgi:AcrR family transcriptional regulator
VVGIVTGVTDRTGRGRVAEARAGQDRAGPDRAGQDRAGQDRAGQDRVGPDRAGAPESARAGHHGNRHGRSEAARLAVLEAADDLLVERGFAGVTIEGIAARAGVAKQTIYRWWDSKSDILFDALVVDAAEFFTAPGHGDLGADLRDHLGQLAAFLTTTDAGAVFRALAGQAQHEPAVAARFEAEFVSRQRDRDREPFRLAGRRGELPAGADVDALIDRLVGPVYYRVLITRADVTQPFTDELVDRCLADLGLG